MVAWEGPFQPCSLIGMRLHTGTIIGGGPVTPRVHSQLAYPGIKARDPCAFRAGRVVPQYKGALPLPHMRRLDFPARWVRARFEPLPISGGAWSLF